MGYQALLFCPDEKTARTVTQVLSELDFAVVPCTEPFAAVKKLMGEHFDAIVVDCDNEQNATLLLKSAHNTVHNQSSLAVAVVEGQAGVAKAFRIGANLVLTKPINVEQAKGTLRVARGLLRKNESAKPATGAANAPAKPVAAVSEPAKPAAKIVSASTTIPQLAPPISFTSKPLAQPQIVASSAASEEDVDLLEAEEEVPSPSTAASVTPMALPKVPVSSATEPKTVDASHKPASVAGFGTSAASAPAPARKIQAEISIAPEPTTSTNSQNSGPKLEGSESPAAATANATPFTFGGNIDESKTAGGAGRKALIAIAAVVLIAAAYGAWMKFGHPSENVPTAVRVSSPTSAQSPVVPNATPTKTSSSSMPVSTPIATPESPSLAKASPASKPLTDTTTILNSEGATAHSNNSADKDRTKNSADPTNKISAKDETKPIVMKSSATKANAKSSTLADSAAPSLTAIAPAQTGTLPNLIGSQSKAPTPVLQTISISQGVSQGLLVHKIQPAYPKNAMTMHVEGAVELVATISKTGDITAVKVLSGAPQLTHAAADAVKQWKYKPYLLNGEPVEIQTQVTINFKLPH